MHSFIIKSNHYLNQNIQAFYHTDYVGYQNPGNPEYINTLKNTFIDVPIFELTSAAQELESVLLEDLPQILSILQLKSLTVCVVPRAKRDYQPEQLLFKLTIHNVVKQLNSFSDGTDDLVRHTNTKTTHLRANIPNHNNDGAMPYPGITIDTCNVLSNIRDKDILLIDDVYTRGVNIDEDAIQALLDKGARFVAFYAVGKTVLKF